MGALVGSGRRSPRFALGTAAAAMSMGALGLGVSPVVAADTAQTELVSIDSTGSQASGGRSPSISADGRFVAFDSEAGNLVAGDSNGKRDVFVYDRASGNVELISLSSTGTQANRGSRHSSISADGRFVAFESSASNLVRTDTSRRCDVFVYDRLTDRIRRVSVSSDGQQGHRDSKGSSISADGRFVSFGSAAPNLVASDTNGHWDLFAHDRATHRTRRVSVSSSGVEANNDTYGWGVSMSADGQFIAFGSDASNLVRSDGNGATDVFVHDQITHRTRRVSISSTGTEANQWSDDASISSDGRVVTFVSRASNLDPYDTNRAEDVFVFDRVTRLTERLTSTDVRGTFETSMSADGRLVAFVSLASNLGSPDTNDAWDVFVHDRDTDLTDRVSVSTTGAQADSISWHPSISADGRFVAFESYATNLALADSDEIQDADVFVHGPLS